MRSLIVVLALMLMSCESLTPSQPVTDLSLASNISNTPTVFVSEAANIHHAYIRECADEILSLPDMIGKTILSEDQAFEYVLGDDRNLIPTVDASSFTMNKHSIELGKMMNKNVSSIELFRYMDKNKCRNEFNEVMVSSYIVINEEHGGLDGIDWAGVGGVDAIATSIATPAAGGAASAGFLLGSIIHDRLN